MNIRGIKSGKCVKMCESLLHNLPIKLSNLNANMSVLSCQNWQTKCKKNVKISRILPIKLPTKISKLNATKMRKYSVFYLENYYCLYAFFKILKSIETCKNIQNMLHILPIKLPIKNDK
jgi:hypothetical protein